MQKEGCFCLKLHVLYQEATWGLGQILITVTSISSEENCWTEQKQGYPSDESMVERAETPLALVYVVLRYT